MTLNFQYYYSHDPSVAGTIENFEWIASRSNMGKLPVWCHRSISDRTLAPILDYWVDFTYFTAETLLWFNDERDVVRKFITRSYQEYQQTLRTQKLTRILYA